MARKPSNRDIAPEVEEEDGQIAEELKISAKEVCDRLGIKLRVLQTDAMESIVREGKSWGTEPYYLETYGGDLDQERFQSLCNKTLEPGDLQYLLRLYRAGKLPFRKRPRSFEVPAAFEAYAMTPRAALVEKSKELATANAAEAAAAAEARRQKLKNLEALQEVEFTYPLLNDVFWHHQVKEGTLVLGGIAVSKSLQLYRSNTGKSKDWQVTFEWLGKDGQRHVLQKDSRFADNRRNDAERNWGLPE
jgi:hypothetical protein